MIAGLQNRVRVQGDPNDPNVRPPPRDLANRDLIRTERPVNELIADIRNIMSLRAQILLREEARRTYDFDRQNPGHNVVMPGLAFNNDGNHLNYDYLNGVHYNNDDLDRNDEENHM